MLSLHLRRLRDRAGIDEGRGYGSTDQADWTDRSSRANRCRRRKWN